MENVETQELAVRPASVSAADFMPLMTVAQAVERKGMINQFIGGVLRESEDYGTIPGAGTKKVLLKPGAEKLCSIFGLSVTYAEDKIIEDWNGDEHGGEPLFYYSYRCQLSRGERFMGEAIGSCNSWESKYRYRWIGEDTARAQFDAEKLATLPKRGGVTSKFEPNFALDKKETTGQYAKPAEYWAQFEAAIQAGTARNVRKKLGKKEFDGWEITMDQTQYRIPNPEIADVINTCQKMAQKRALVAAVLVVTNCSDSFTQDVEDFGDAPSAPVQDGFPPPQRQPEDLEITDADKELAKKPFPIEMLSYLEKIQKNRNAFPAVCTAMADKMILRGGGLGSEAYDRVADSITRRWPNGISNPVHFKTVLTELWEAYQSLPEYKTPFDGDGK
jgi:hypothetical protein